VIEIDAASHGGVDDARELREKAFFGPASSRYKIYIIDEAHMVTSGGFNALLKLVEEPPPHLKFVFATTEPEKVIPTIKSRTHHYPFRLVPPSVLRGLLEEILAAESVSYEPTVLPLVIRAGAGSVRDSLSVLDQLLAGAGPEGLTYERTVALLGYTDDSLLDEMVDAMAAGDGAAVFGTVDRVVQGGHDPRRFAADLLDRLRDLIILGAVPGAGQTGLLDAPADRLEKMSGQAGRFGQAELARTAEILSDGLIQMRGTTSPRLLLELMCAQVLLPGASTGEKALAARLERLERRLDGLGSADLSPGPAVGGTRSASSAPAATAPPSAAPPAERHPAASAAAGAAPASEAAHAPEAAPVRGAPRGREAAQGRDASGAREASAALEAPDAAVRGTSPAREAPAREMVAREAPARETAGRDAGVRDAERRHAGARETTAPGTAAREAPGREAVAREAPARTAPPARPGVIDADTLRQRWPDVLEAVKSERRVAWMLLNSASVDSLEGGILTVAFAKEGQAKGFAASGHDQVLTGVLATMLGLNVRVRAAVGTASGSQSARPGSAGPAPRTGASGRATRPDATGSGSGSAGSGSAGSSTAGSGNAGPGDTTDRPGGSADGPGAPGGMQGNAETPPGGFQAHRGQGGQGGMSGAGGAPAGRRASSPPRPPQPRSGRGTSAPAATDPEEEWPDDAGPADGGAGPTGMELIERRLGGTVIEEIDEP